MNTVDFGCKNVIYNEPMSRHTTFKIGGNADVFVIPESVGELIFALNVCEENGIPVFILGNGSNLVVSDKGIRGAVIYTGGLDGIKLNENGSITAFAGVKLSDVCRFAQKNSLSGLEFAFGIPGTLGGGVYMNAGAYGGELKDVILSVTALNKDNEIVVFKNGECDFSYRHSLFMQNGFTVISADFLLKKGEKEAIAKEMEDVLLRRKTKQPLEYPSAGSVFRRPEGYFAGALIENADLKGYRVGDAQVSEKHAGFIVNRGNATCEDVKNLVSHIQKTVREKDGVELNCEIKFVGEE